MEFVNIVPKSICWQEDNKWQEINWLRHRPRKCHKQWKKCSVILQYCQMSFLTLNTLGIHTINHCCTLNSFWFGSVTIREIIWRKYFHITNFFKMLILINKAPSSVYWFHWVSVFLNSNTVLRCIGRDPRDYCHTIVELWRGISLFKLVYNFSNSNTL